MFAGIDEPLRSLRQARASQLQCGPAQNAGDQSGYDDMIIHTVYELQ